MYVLLCFYDNWKVIEPLPQVSTSDGQLVQWRAQVSHIIPFHFSALTITVPVNGDTDTLL